MVSVKISTSGDFSKTEKFLKNASTISSKNLKIAEKYAQKGVNELAKATPKDTGYTSECWGYEIETKPGFVTIYFTNSHIEKGYANIAILLQYGHGTGNGGWVEGRDYINPALKSTFKDLANEFYLEVTSS